MMAGSQGSSSTYLGNHTSAVQRGLNMGVALFIISEGLFFWEYFEHFFHSTLRVPNRIPLLPRLTNKAAGSHNKTSTSISHAYKIISNLQTSFAALSIQASETYCGESWETWSRLSWTLGNNKKRQRRNLRTHNSYHPNSKWKKTSNKLPKKKYYDTGTN